MKNKTCSLAGAFDPSVCPHIRLDKATITRSGKALVSEIDLALKRGEFLAVTGPSGAGKSSFLAFLSGSLQGCEGGVEFVCQEGCRHDAPSYRRRVGVVFQNLLLIPNHTVLQNVLCGRLGRYHWVRTLMGFPKSDREEARELLHELRLEHLADVPVRRISGGEAQRTAAARALFQEPEVILADEPVSQLDGETARLTLEVLRRRSRLLGATVICVLHQRELAQEFADRELRLGVGEEGGWIAGLLAA